ncbi:hypothetical protein KSP35_06925 [Aquihabitans sp. G128]|nr:hypothetical protein [Aquihabitans sp. G128]QXC62528.1 hypothetical protein KSP35_06925 [Aquihabitans sp. G128]
MNFEAGDVVGEQRGLEALAAAAHRLDHLGAHVTGEQAQHVPPRHAVPGARRLLFERRCEPVEVDLAALELRPRVGVGIGGVHAADEVDGKAVVDLVAGERVEGARQDHAAEVEQCCGHGHGC